MVIEKGFSARTGRLGKVNQDVEPARASLLLDHLITSPNHLISNGIAIPGMFTEWFQAQTIDSIMLVALM